MKKKTAAPSHLRAKTRRWYLAVLELYDLEENHLRLLQAACEAWDRCQDAREAIKKQGTTYEDRFGQPKTRPEAAIERDARAGLLAALRELDLDQRPKRDVRRDPFADVDNVGDAMRVR